MAKKTKDDFLMQAINTAVDLAVQSTERIADLLPADLFAPAMAPATQRKIPFRELIADSPFGQEESEDSSNELF